MLLARVQGAVPSDATQDTAGQISISTVIAAATNGAVAQVTPIASEAIAAVTAQAALAQAAVLGLPYYPLINASTAAGGSNIVPQGITSGTVGGTAVTGATPGTYALTPTGGDFTGVQANLVVADATHASIVIVNPGRTTSASPAAPTWAKPSGATLPSGTTLTANIGTQIGNGTGQYYLTSDSTGANLLYWQNTGTGAPVAVLDGASHQVKYPLASQVAAAASTLPLFASATSANIYFPDTTLSWPAGARAGHLYNNTNGTDGALAYFGASGIISGLTIGQQYTIDLSGAPADLSISSGQGIFWWNSNNSYNSQSTTGPGVVFSNGNRTAVITAVTAKAAFNLVRAGNVTIDAPTWAATLGALMVNAGATPLLYVPPVNPAAPLAPGPAFAVPTYSDHDDVRVYYDGVQFYYARIAWDATYDRVVRYRFGYTPDANGGNGLWDSWGERLIPVAATMPQIVQAWNLCANAQILRGGIDENSPFNIGEYLGGGHGPVGVLTTTGAHSFAQGDIGAIYTDGTRTWTLAQINGTTGASWLAATNTGTSTSWAFYVGAISGTTLTHVSGGIQTAALTISAQATTQVYPFIRNRVGSAMIDGRAITAAGIYSGKRLKFLESYNVPNLASAIARIIAHVGDSDNSLIHSAIDTQLTFSCAYSIDWTGVTTRDGALVTEEIVAASQYGGAQTPRPSQPPGTTTSMVIPGTVPFTFNATSYNFAAVAGNDITTDANAITFDSSKWALSTKPPTNLGYLNLTGSTVNFGVFYGLDDSVGAGLPAARQNVGYAILKAATTEKVYITAVDQGISISAGQLFQTRNWNGAFNPATDPALTWVVPYPKGTKTAYSIRAPGALTRHWVPIDPRLIGQPVVISRDNSAVATLFSSVVNELGVMVTTSGIGEIELTIG